MASLGLVLVVGVTEFERTAPGALSRVHESDPALAGMNDCSACHGGWFETMADACLECHQQVAAHLDEDRGLHGMLLPDDGATRCALCHSEHHGEGFAVVNRSSFALAGVPDPQAFDHASIGFDLAGAHLELDCTECHEHAEAELPPPGEFRYLGLQQDCASCHDDPHEGAMQLDCTACHGQAAFDIFEPRDHGAQLPLVGGHGGLDCATCHEVDSPFALEALGARGGASGARSCTDCHDSPHHPGFVAGTAWLAEASRDMICAHCHRADHESFREPGLSVDAEQHAQSGFPLTLPHDELDCAQCHAGGPESSFDERYPGRTAESCAACHDDPHAGQFTLPVAQAADCLDCHDRHRFEPHTFDSVAHDLLAMPLTDSHAALDCEACHAADGPEGTRVFRGTAERCEQCHTDAHEGFFDAFFAPVSAQAVPSTPAAGDCASCHATTHFDDVDREAFDHAAFTDFAIRDAHAQSECESCHPRAAEPDFTGRSFGRVAEHFGDFMGCVTCHADPHAGAFDQPSLPAFVDGRADCARCHAESSFRVLPRGFDHSLWTGYPLEGHHAELDCSACHAPLATPSPEGRSWDHALGTSCADCHSDPHAGQFLERGETDCAACHRNTRSFLDMRFDHDRDARFPLGDAHRNVSCAECHESVPWGPLEIVRYKPLDTQCVDCHGLDEALLLRRLEESR